MPRYSYRCSVCSSVSTHQHLSNERATTCPECDRCGALVKLVTTFTTKPTGPTQEKVGQVTEEFIQDARQDLKQQVKELNKKK